MNYSIYGFKESDFNGLKIPIHKVPDDVDPYDVIPILNKYPEFSPNLPKIVNKRSLLTYVILAFDKKSPLKMKFPDPIEQRVKSAHIAGFRTNKDDTFPKHYEAIIKSEVFEVNMMVITYLFLQNENDILTLTAYEEALRLQTHNLLNSDSGSDTKFIIGNIDNLRGAIEHLKRNLVEIENDTLLNQDLFTYTQSKRLKIKPEDYMSEFVIGKPQPKLLINDPDVD